MALYLWNYLFSSPENDKYIVLEYDKAHNEIIEYFEYPNSVKINNKKGWVDVLKKQGKNIGNNILKSSKETYEYLGYKFMDWMSVAYFNYYLKMNFRDVPRLLLKSGTSDTFDSSNSLIFNNNMNEDLDDMPLIPLIPISSNYNSNTYTLTRDMSLDDIFQSSVPNSNNDLMKLEMDEAPILNFVNDNINSNNINSNNINSDNIKVIGEDLDERRQIWDIESDSDSESDNTLSDALSDGSTDEKEEVMDEMKRGILDEILREKFSRSM
jgi:hypothetical protein